MFRVYFARLLLLVAVIVGIVLLIGTCLPRSFNVRQSIVIDAPPQLVYAQLADLSQWLKWSPWSQFPAEVESTSDRQGETRTALVWQDPRGDGRLWLTALEPDRSVDYRMDFGGFRDLAGRISLSPRQPTRVTWTIDGALPAGPFYGYFRLFFHREMERQMALSLARLQTLVAEQ